MAIYTLVFTDWLGNFSDKHEENHRPEMHKGTVIKINANQVCNMVDLMYAITSINFWIQRYATTAVTTVVLKELAKTHNIPIQEFVVRNDSPCGSTIGPMLSAKLGLRTVGMNETST
jgi:aspartyl aminopeptidase